MICIRKQGFTLIEIVVTLVLVGILSSIAGMGVVKAMEAYVFTRESSAMAQKTQAAFARLSKTIINISDVDFTGIGDPSKKLIVTLERANVEVTETYEFADGALTLTVSDATAHILIDGLDTDASGFIYLENDGSNWNTSSPEDDLSRIQIVFAMTSSSGQTVTFPGTFVPRNIYRPVDVTDFNAGGTAIPDISACFISTVARDERDKGRGGGIVVSIAGLVLIVLVAARRRA